MRSPARDAQCVVTPLSTVGSGLRAKVDVTTLANESGERMAAFCSHIIGNAGPPRYGLANLSI